MHGGSAGKKGGDDKSDDDEEQEVAMLLKRIKAAHPPAEVIKVGRCTLSCNCRTRRRIEQSTQMQV